MRYEALRVRITTPSGQYSRECCGDAVSVLTDCATATGHNSEDNNHSGDIYEPATSDDPVVQWENFLLYIAGKVSTLLNSKSIKEVFKHHSLAFLVAYDHWRLALNNRMQDALENPALCDVQTSPVDSDYELLELERYFPFGDDAFRQLDSHFIWGLPLPPNPLEVFVPQDKWGGIFPNGDALGSRRPVSEGEESQVKYFLLAVIHANKSKIDMPLLDELADGSENQHEAACEVWSTYGEPTENQLYHRSVAMKTVIDTALTFAQAGLEKMEGVNSESAETEKIVIHDQDLTVLYALDIDVLKIRVTIAAQSRMKDGAVKDSLKRLEQLDLASRPSGRRKGYVLTDKGKKYLESKE